MTFIPGLRCDRLTAPRVIEGAMTGDAFKHYIKTQLASTLKKGDVVVLDYLPAHKRKEAAEAIEGPTHSSCSCHHMHPTLTLWDGPDTKPRAQQERAWFGKAHQL